jgi:hypothetical protein
LYGWFKRSRPTDSELYLVSLLGDDNFVFGVRYSELADLVDERWSIRAEAWSDQYEGE